MLKKSKIRTYLMNNLTTEEKYVKDKFLIEYYLGKANIGCLIYNPIYKNLRKEVSYYQWEVLNQLPDVDVDDPARMFLEHFDSREKAEEWMETLIIEWIDKITTLF